MSKKEKPKEKAEGDGTDVFREKWMNRCFKTVAYPDPACVKVMELVSRALSKRVTQPQESALKQQALFSLLGPEYTEQYFPYQKYNIKILDPPKIKPAQREKYVEEMREFLKKSLDLAMKDLGYPDDISTYKADDELGHFVQNVSSTFREGLRKHTSHIQQEEDVENEKRKKEQEVKKSKKKKENDDGESENSDDEDEDGDKEKGNNMSHTKPSDICSQAMLALIAHDSSNKDQYLQSIRERHLGFNMTLRRYFWRDYLEEKEKTRKDIKEEDDIMPAIRREFNKNLKKEMKAQNISRAIQSHNHGDIDAAVIETYDYTKSLRSLDTDEHMIQTSRALNILCVYTKAFSVSNIHWLMPLQQ
ncbi:hypothetical protein SK128_018530, partial [Halocaridina rubra]